MAATVGPTTYFDPARVDELAPGTADLVRRRVAALGPAYRLFYDAPVQFVRGEGVHLYDVDGVEYLDAYNNVPSVGHAHPRVVAAIAAQAALLTTHTRYLHAGIVDYAEDLLSTMPDGIEHVMFACTGSEAGDLALRIAKAATGSTGVIVTRNAYHGVTTEMAAISPSLGGLASLPEWVRVVPAPDAYRVDTTGHADLGGWFAARVQEAVDDLAAHGIGLAAVVLDSIFASDGVLDGPRGFLAPVLDVVHRAGGLYVADEVQPGFGRTGDALWGFARHDTDGTPFVPDIVTMGKPMGNGYPVAGTAMRADVAERFGRQMRYFNTFGGNPVAMAAAQATLDVVRDEGLQHNALVVGSRLRELISAAAADHASIGDVRGAGLFTGIELVEPDRTAATDLTLSVVNGLQRRRVLVATGGLDNNVLKVRPPLVFSDADTDRFVTELDAVLTELDA